MKRALVARLALVLGGVLAVFVACLPPPAGKRVDVGGHRLRYIQKSAGGPTVVFDAGLGDTLETWDAVWPPVAESSTVFLYDRAGMGRSDPGPLPRSSEQIVRELRALLTAAGADGPFVLVGHSFGALNMRLFAARHPDDVAGLVLVDPTPIEYPSRESELISEESHQRIQTLLPLGRKAMRHEREFALESADQVSRAGPLPPVPVIVLTSTRPDEQADFRKAWLEMQERLASRLGARRHEITEDSGHYIQYDQPQLVVDAIREILRLRATDDAGGKTTR